MEGDEGTVAEIALIENMQRKDLTVWEEADGLLSLCERFGYTHDDVARKVGKSRTTVSEALAIARIPDDVREVCRTAEINAKSSLLQIVRQPDDESMRRLAKEIATRGLNRNDAREVRRQEMGPRVVPDSKPYTFKYASPDKDFNIEVKFKASQVSDAEVALILRAVADEIDDVRIYQTKKLEESVGLGRSRAEVNVGNEEGAITSGSCFADHGCAPS